MRYIKKGAGIFCESTRVKYAFIDSHSGNYKTNDLCRAIEVKESGYYDWNKRKINEKTDMEIIEKIKNIHQSLRMIYGYRRVHAELRGNMMDINHKKVARLMRENDIFSKRKNKFKITTKTAKKAVKIDNILNRNFVTDAPNKVWVSESPIFK